MKPPKPFSRPSNVGFLRYLMMFKKDMLSAHSVRLYNAWMAGSKNPLFESYLCNDPKLVNVVLRERPNDFPKSKRFCEGLSPLLGNSVFLNNGDAWERQRKTIDSAFENKRLREIFPEIWAAADTAIAKIPMGKVELEEQMSRAAADVIFRILFSTPIEEKDAAQTFEAFRQYQRHQPLLNLAAFIALPQWFPRFHNRKAKQAAQKIRAFISCLVQRHISEAADKNILNDLVTGFMRVDDSSSKKPLGEKELIDQIVTLFLAGHETSASALAWGLYLLALYPNIQERVFTEAKTLPETADLSSVSRLKLTRDVFRETLRLYPPIPMIPRENRSPESFRGRNILPGREIIISPWYLHRHQRLWKKPDDFDPDRWELNENKTSAQNAYIPFSAGARVCGGASLAMMEGTLFLAKFVKAFHFSVCDGHHPVPVAHLTVRSAKGIFLNVSPR